jgi:hypothetical protein
MAAPKKQLQGLGLQAAAAALHMSKKSLNDYRRDGVVQQLPDGSFDVEDCRKRLLASRERNFEDPAHLARLRDVGADIAAVVDGDESIKEATRRKVWEEVREKRRRNAIAERQLVDLGEVNVYMRGCITMAAQEFRRIPTELRDVLAEISDPNKIESELTKAIDIALAHLAEYKPRVSEKAA